MQQFRFGGVIVALLLGLSLTGCGKGAKQDSPFRGSYRAVYEIPAISETGNFTFTVEQKGNMIGSLVDSNNGKTYGFNGSIEPNGNFNGTTVDGGVSYPTRGTLTTQNSPGGNFIQTRSGTQQLGSFVITDVPITEAPSSAFRGAYRGSYNVPGLSQNGVTSFSVNSKGEITGSLTRGDETGLLTGTVKNSGSFTANADFSGTDAALVGTLNPTTNGTTSGNFTYAQNGASAAGSFGETQVIASGDSPFQGAYRGTYALPENAESGTVSFTVDPRGTILGYFSRQQNQQVATFTGDFANDGSFTGDLRYPAGSGVPVRQIIGKIAKSTVGSSAGLFSGDYILTINGENVPGNFEVSVGASEPDSRYRSAYTDSGLFFPAFGVETIPGGIISTSNSGVEFNVDKEGEFIGAFGVNRVKGRVTNDGRVVGFITGTDGLQYPFRGIVNKLTWNFPAPQDDLPGIKADLLITVNNKDYSAFIKATGGDGEIQ